MEQMSAPARLIATVSIVTLVLVACGDGGPAADGPAAEPTTEVQPSPEVEPSPAATPTPQGPKAPIVVDRPLPDSEVTSPVSIAGSANVFEATVSIRVLDAEENVITETFTTATCGTGCRGDYSESVSFEVDTRQPGTIEVYEASAEDGSQLFTVRVPVTLVPN